MHSSYFLRRLASKIFMCSLQSQATTALVKWKASTGLWPRSTQAEWGQHGTQQLGRVPWHPLDPRGSPPTSSVTSVLCFTSVAPIARPLVKNVTMAQESVTDSLSRVLLQQNLWNPPGDPNSSSSLERQLAQHLPLLSGKMDLLKTSMQGQGGNRPTKRTLAHMQWWYHHHLLSNQKPKWRWIRKTEWGAAATGWDRNVLTASSKSGTKIGLWLQGRPWRSTTDMQ